MDYTVNINGIDIIIEQHSAEARQQSTHQQRNRLLTYYKKLLRTAGIEETSKRENALNNLIDNMTEKSAEIKADNFEQNQLKRILTYAEKITGANEGPNKIADALVEVLDTIADENIDNQETVDINGNKFIYDKSTLNIKDHVQKLFDIGKSVKGNTWTIYLDEEGELVIY